VGCTPERSSASRAWARDRPHTIRVIAEALGVDPTAFDGAPDGDGTESAQTHEIDSDRGAFERDFPSTGVAV
jgi:hypothetical protein